MSILGNMAGCYSPMGKTFILTDGRGTEFTGVVVGQETVFTATDNDVREGKVYAGEEGVKTGEKVIPSYHTTEGYVYIDIGEDCNIILSNLDTYDYTKLQVIICKYNETIINSVNAEKIVMEDNVYMTNSTDVVSTVTKNSSTKTIELGITNNGDTPLILRYFTYKKID